ncbi:MAG: hypothetical protein ACRDOG_01495 [Gaiellaceae bacterium]
MWLEPARYPLRMGDQKLEQERADRDRDRSEEAHWRVAEAGADQQDEPEGQTRVPERDEPEGRTSP